MQGVFVVTITYVLIIVTTHTHTVVITILHTQCHDSAVQSDWLNIM